MVGSVTRTRLSAPGALFAFLTAVVVTLFGVVPASVATTRQPGDGGDATATAPGDAGAGTAVSVATPDDSGENFPAPSPLGTPAGELPEHPAQTSAFPAQHPSLVESTGPRTRRGRAPPR